MKRFDRELKIAMEAVRIATEITKWFSIAGFKSFQKLDKSPVTLADYASQFFITSRIAQFFPEDQIIAEETDEVKLTGNDLDLIKLCYDDLNIDNEMDLSPKKLKSERQWTVDPIDGTKGFQKHLSYAIGIGLMVNSKPCISIIGVPNFNEKGTAIFTAEKENGAKVSYGGEPLLPIEVSKLDTLSESLMCHSLHYDEPWVMKFALETNITKFIQMDSMAKFCLIANGGADIYIKPLNKERSFSWDFLPGTLLVSEAGGKVSDLNGNPLKFLDEKLILSTPGLIASNSHIHQEILRSMRKFNFGYK